LKSLLDTVYEKSINYSAHIHCWILIIIMHQLVNFIQNYSTNGQNNHLFQ
jgi:hypothetical protein